MTQRDPLKLPRTWAKLDRLKDLFEQSTKRPLTGITQGGSSRTDSGAASAASDHEGGSEAGSTSASTTGAT